VPIVILIGAASLLAAVFGHLDPRRAFAFTCLALGIAALGIINWWRIAPSPLRQTEIVLYDADLGSSVSVKRLLSAIPLDEDGTFSTRTGELIRHVRGDAPGNLALTLPTVGGRADSSNSDLSSRSTGIMAAVSSESVETERELGRLPVRMWTVRNGKEICLHIDTTA
jgi:hypothetical protein